MERPEILLFNINVSSPYPNLGIASLAAYLKERGVHVLHHTCSFLGVSAVKPFSPLRVKNRLLFQGIEAFLAGEKTFSQLSENQRVITKILTLWAQVIHRENPVSLGISVTTPNVLFSLLLIRIVKKSLPGIKIILGGPERSVTTGAFFSREGYADVVVVGEGEVPLYETLCCIREQRPIAAPGVMTLVNNEVVSFPIHPYPLDINALPAPDFDKAFIGDGKPFALPIGFNRGCSFRCAFCNERVFWKTFRQMNAAKAVAILEQLKETYGINRFFSLNPL
ncbi:MAG: cobalamin B12-binding domain protein [Candidatus Brocadiaceae bacterium]|nr:cobalamin B12-binding domain protein [Candidatus Brocadiaceae bacterium]